MSSPTVTTPDATTEAVVPSPPFSRKLMGNTAVLGTPPRGNQQLPQARSHSPAADPPVPIPLWRWAVRFLLVLTMAAACWLLWASNPQVNRPLWPQGWSPQNTIVITLAQGENYGQTDVWLGEAGTGTRIVDQAALGRAILENIPSDPETGRVLLRVSGGVYQSEINRRVRFIRQTLQHVRSVEVALALLPTR